MKENKPAGGNSFRTHLLIALGLAALTIFLYARSFSYPFIGWDDPAYVTENSAIRSISAPNLAKIFTRTYAGIYVPVTMLSFTIDYQLYGLKPAGYRVTNVVLHAANAALLYGVIFILTGNALAAAGAALIFAVHPLQPESVVWIAQRKQVLSVLFFLIGFMLHLRARRAGKENSRTDALVYALFVLACLSKGLMVVMPAVLFLYDYCYGRLRRRSIMLYALYLAGALGMTALTFLMFARDQVTASLAVTPQTAMMTTLVILARYFLLMLWPVNQSILYGLPVYTTLGHPHVLLAVLLAAAIAALMWFLHQRRRDLFFWAAWYFIFLLPVMRFFHLPQSFMQDRWLYISIPGFFVLLFLVLERAAGRKALLALLAAAAVIYAGLNLKRQEVWSSSEALWRDTQVKNAESRTLGQNYVSVNLGMDYLDRNEPEKARAQFETALRAAEDPMAYSGLGLVELRAGNFARAEEYFKRAVSAMPNTAAGGGNTTTIFVNLGVVYEKQGKLDLAVREYERAVSLQPENLQFRQLYASGLLQTGKPAEAKAQLLRSIEIDPHYPDALLGLGVLCEREGKRGEAEVYWRKLIAAHPGHPLAEEARRRLNSKP